jgi:hypothetical protein
MNNFDAVKSLLLDIAGQSNIIAVPRLLIKVMNDSLGGGVFLSQLIYWSDKGSDKNGWFYKTYDEWEEETTLSKYKIRKYTEELTKIGILETKIKKANGAPTVHYRLQITALIEWIVKNLTMESEVASQSLTETTTETTFKHATPEKNGVAEVEAFFEEKEKNKSRKPLGKADLPDPALGIVGAMVEFQKRGDRVRETVQEYPADVQEVVEAFYRVFKIPIPSKQAGADFKKWIKFGRRYAQRLGEQGADPTATFENIKKSAEKGEWVVTDIQSIQNVLGGNMDIAELEKIYKVDDGTYQNAYGEVVGTWKK